MNILLILLGCNISNLLNNRIETAIHFVQKFNQTNIDWYLSGGIKNPNEDTISEAYKMANQISNFEKKYNRELNANSWNYILDIEATNTAENFITAKNYIENIKKDYDAVYIVTSKFHHDRAKKISEKILNNIETKWILGNLKLEDSIYWEKIHIKNVDSDVIKAFNKFTPNHIQK